MTREWTPNSERPRVGILARAMTVAAVALALPGAALADSTGGQAAPTPGSTAAAPQSHSVVRPSGPPNPSFQLTAPATTLAKSRVRLSGLLRHGGGRVVRVQYRLLGGAWSQVKALRAARDGSFAAAWKPATSGPYELRAVARLSRVRMSGIRAVSVFDSGTATWYGPGFYGKSTACGVTLTETTLGVAHRSLPCGTPVFVTYAGRGVVVPVIDRGPYTKGAQWDLTGAAAQAIGMSQTSRIGVIVGTPTW